MLTDTHAHLYWDSFKEDFDAVIERGLDAGVSTIINVGVDVEKSRAALRQAQGKLAEIPGLSVYSTIGIHPEEAEKYSSNADLQNDIRELEKIYLSDPKRVVAVGECGLDYSQNNSYNGHNYYNFHNSQAQLFQAQIDLAKKLNLPLIIHCRSDRSQDPANTECWDKVIEMTRDHFGIYHCYSGLSQTTNCILQATKFLISFAATITYPKNEYLREAAKIIPLDRIVLETDCPFLPPQNKRGQRNEPSSVKEVAEQIARLKGIPLAEVVTQTTKNAKIVFSI